MGKYDFELNLYGDNTISWIAERIRENSKVLEFGPANGRLTKYLNIVKRCEVDIVEIDEESGHEAEKYAAKAYIGREKGDIEKYYWVNTEKKYDFIVFADVLEHLICPSDVILRCKAIIDDNGKILVSIPNVSHNSVIIELLNDDFTYTSTGILDNTHLRFFTRKTFEQMIQESGWTIVEEKAKNIRVGETEISNTYHNVSKEIFKELAHRPNGNVYQYMFTLASSDDYLSGKCESIISLDSSSYYYAQVQYLNEGQFDYKKSVSRHFDPYNGYIDIKLSILDNSKSAQIFPINCNCVLQNIRISTIADNNELRENLIFSSNGIRIGNKYYYNNEPPKLHIDLKSDDSSLIFKADILKYDFEDRVFDDILLSLVNEKEQVEKLVIDYDKEIQRREHERNSMQKEYSQSIEAYEKEIQRRDNEKNELIAGYEKEIRRREEERKDMQVAYDAMNNKHKQDGGIKNNIKKQGDLVWHFIKNKFQRKIIDCDNTAPGTFKGEILGITAVIPNYNYANYLDQRLDSILNQTYPVKEIIILDDCSSDNSVEVIERRIRDNNTGVPIHFFRNETNSGNVFAQWQKAFQLATCDYVWIAEADDSSNERFLETVMQGFQDPDVIISYCESLTIDEKNVLLMGDLRVWIDIFSTGKWDNDYINDGIKEVEETMCINNTIANVSSAVIKNGDYFEILENAKEYHLAGDWFTYMNLLKKGKIAYFHESLNYHRMQSKGLTLSTSHETEFAEIVRLQNYAMENFDISEEVKKKIYERREQERKRFGL